MSRGYFFIAFGTDYITEVFNLSKTLNKFGNTYPISILCSETDKEYVESIGIFEKIITYNFDNEFSKLLADVIISHNLIKLPKII